MPRGSRGGRTTARVFAALSGLLLVSGIGLGAYSALGSSAHETGTISPGAGSYSYYTFTRFAGEWFLTLSLMSIDGPVDACLLSEAHYKDFVRGDDPFGRCVHAEPDGRLDVIGDTAAPVHVNRFDVVLMHSRGMEGREQRVRVDMWATGVEAILFLLAIGAAAAGATLLGASVLHRRRKSRLSRAARTATRPDP